MTFRGSFRFVLVILLFVWVLLSIHLIYRYIDFVSYEANAKTGTFVEGITDDNAISYLPYTSFSEGNRFYQTFLFDACLDYSFDGAGKLAYQEDLCSVSSDDEKTYTVTILDDPRWSDGESVSIRDVYSIYRRILVDNIRNKKDLDLFGDVSVSLGSGELTVVFPESSKDNRMFFTHFILPATVADMSFDTYRDTFLRLPVRSDCALLQSQDNDPNSLVFDLSECDDTFLLRYQLKLLTAPETTEYSTFLGGLSTDFFDLLSLGGLATQEVQINGFSRMRVPLREYAVMFFNTESDKLSAKILRALGGLVFHNFYEDDDYKSYLIREHLGFDVFQSTGDSVAKYIIAKNPSISLDKYDLEKIDVTALPQKLSMQGEDDYQIYFLEEVRGYKTVEIALSQPYGAVRIIQNSAEPYTPKTYNSEKGNFFYSLSVYNKNLIEGRNTYVVEASIDGVWKKVGSFEVYYLTAPLEGSDEASIADEDKLQVVYQITDVSSRVVADLQQLFEKEGLNQYFARYGFDDADQFYGKLSSLDYDIVIGDVDVGLREDLSTLFSSENPRINPSLYTQESFVSLLGSVVARGTEYNSLMDIYSNDVPFVVLGQLFDAYFIDSPLTSYSPDDVKGVYHFKRKLYNDVTFGVQKMFLWSDLFSKKKFLEFFGEL